jgi:NADPH:quinone reductase-like Zn-dependent oxidoreductase
MLKQFEQLEKGDTVVQNGATSAVGQVSFINATLCVVFT